MNDCINSSTNEFHISSVFSSAIANLVIFIALLFVYVITISGNLTITTLICAVPQLHSPMYFFLFNLSIVDVMYVSATIPKLLSISLVKDKTIYFHSCIIQLYIFLVSANLEIYILTSMAFDRYVAICKPLQYSVIMTNRLCVILSASSWTLGTLNSILETVLTLKLQFCHSHDINHFFCDLKTLMALSTTDTSSWEILNFAEDAVFASLPFLLTILSYVFIISTILKIRSPGRRHKVFSSCSSHLTTVVLFYAPMLSLYTTPDSAYSKDIDKLLSLIYMVVVPMLNPFVYTLRNQDFLKAFRKLTNINKM
ncbi:hypothetical protein GDO78_015226 [Eleutherodactylus coqui]|uniref:Olfactory receptor n=1 Tax=Eleutherodactylus coqui TaxID=57060 RepID=A0A8J6EE03_ELECQ|nr:hypothetical protein GDO78_015226 [Eleutherodactylus coqui]